MEIIKRVMPRDYVLIDSSDYHYGSATCARDSIKEMVNKVATNKNYFLLNKGDSIEAILPNDPRYTSCSVDFKSKLLTPMQQADAVINDFMPIRDRIVAWGQGNHEQKLSNTMDFGLYMAQQLGVDYGAYSYKFHAIDKNGELMHKMYLTHGFKMSSSKVKDDIQRVANRKAGLRNALAGTCHSDCIYMSCGHTHQLLTVEPTVQNKLYLTDDGKRIKQHYQQMSPQNVDYIYPEARWYGCSGSFLKLYADPGDYVMNYAEVAGYEPSEIGWLEIHVQDGNVCAVEKIIA